MSDALEKVLAECEFVKVTDVDGLCEVLFSGAPDSDTAEIIGDPAIHGTGGFRLSIHVNDMLHAEPPDGDGCWVVRDVDGEYHAITPYKLVRFDHIDDLRRINELI